MKEVALISSIASKNGAYLGDLDAKHDWAHAKDYVEMQWLTLQQVDYVFASGVQYSVRDVVYAVACEPYIKIHWEGKGIDDKGCDAASKCIAADDARYFRPVEVETLLGDASKAKEKLGWETKIYLDELVNNHGYITMDYHE